eukprot:429718-Pelagomonas_calceolata.AAC.3
MHPPRTACMPHLGAQLWVLGVLQVKCQVAVLGLVLGIHASVLRACPPLCVLAAPLTPAAVQAPGAHPQHGPPGMWQGQRHKCAATNYLGECLPPDALPSPLALYELLDEVMDHGYPQITDPTVLKSLITQRGFSGDLPVLAVEMMQKAQRKKDEPAPNATLTVTGAVGWRRPGIKYKKNELFLDTVEQVNVQMSANGKWWWHDGIQGEGTPQLCAYWCLDLSLQASAKSMWWVNGP